MYRDEMWYRKLVQDVDEHRGQLSEKQWAKYQIDLLLRLAARVRDNSERCETCRGFQHPLTRLEEELQELPDSRAQRDYQAGALAQMAEHFVAEHRLAPPGYYVRKWLRYGIWGGLGMGIAALLFTGYLIALPAGIVIGAAAAWLLGSTEDGKVKQERRHL